MRYCFADLIMLHVMSTEHTWMGHTLLEGQEPILGPEAFYLSRHFQIETLFIRTSN